MDIVQISETLTAEFSSAVKAAESAKAAAVDDIARRLDEANETRQEALARVRKMREDAARLVSDSIAIEEQAEANYRSAHRAIRDALTDLRGTVPPAKAVARKQMRAIEGGKQAAEG